MSLRLPGWKTAVDFYYLRGSAAAGDAQAQFALANYYYRGLGIPQDYYQALIWYRKSAVCRVGHGVLVSASHDGGASGLRRRHHGVHSYRDSI
jgi:hypothetical protein